MFSWSSVGGVAFGCPYIYIYVYIYIYIYRSFIQIYAIIYTIHIYIYVCSIVFKNVSDLEAAVAQFVPEQDAAKFHGTGSRESTAATNFSDLEVVVAHFARNM